MCGSDPNAVAPASECRADFVLVNHEIDANCHDRAITLAQKNGPPFAHVLRIGDPSPEWLASNHLGPLSDEQRAAFDRDGIVLLLQHPMDPSSTLRLERIAADAVCFGYVQLDAQRPYPRAKPGRDDARERLDAELSARTHAIIAHLDAMTEVDRAAYFVQAFRDKVVGTQDGTFIDVFAGEKLRELHAAIARAWSERRHLLRDQSSKRAVTE